MLKIEVWDQTKVVLIADWSNMDAWVLIGKLHYSTCTQLNSNIYCIQHFQYTFITKQKR